MGEKKMPKWQFDYNKGIEIQNNRIRLFGEKILLKPGFHGGTHTSNYIAKSNIKLINISELTLRKIKDTVFLNLPDDVECTEKQDKIICIQKDFDGRNLKIDLMTHRGVRVIPPPNWRSLEIQKSAKNREIGGRKAAFKQRYRREE